MDPKQSSGSKVMLTRLPAVARTPFAMPVPLETNPAQQPVFINGTFYDDQGQVIAETAIMADYWPLEFILPGAQIPFELTISGLQNAADFNLSLEAQLSAEMFYQDFEFSEINQLTEAGNFCMAGQLRNLGPPMENYPIIGTILSDRPDNMVNFNHQQDPSFEQLNGDQPLTIEVCQDVAHYDLHAWG